MIKVEDALSNLHYQTLRFENGTEPYIALQMAIEALEQKSKSEWEHDHEILKAYSDGANDILDKIIAEISAELEKDYGHYDILTTQGIRTGYLSALSIIDKYKEESKEGADNGSRIRRKENRRG